MSALKYIAKDLEPILSMAGIKHNANKICTELQTNVANDQSPPHSNLTDNDLKKINIFSKKIKGHTGQNIAHRFNEFHNLEAKIRAGVALDFFNKTPRRGLMLRGYGREQVESVLDHSRHLAHMNALAVKNIPALSQAFNQEASNRNLTRDNLVIAMLTKALIHDLAEVLTTDLTPYDINEYLGGDKDKKAAIEDIAHRLLYQNEPVLAKLIDEYEEKKGLEDIINKTNDILEWLADILLIEHEYPEKTGRQILKDSRQYETSFDQFHKNSHNLLQKDNLAQTYNIYGGSVVEYLKELHDNHGGELKAFVSSHNSPFERRSAFIQHIMGEKEINNFPKPPYLNR